MHLPCAVYVFFDVVLVTLQDSRCFVCMRADVGFCCFFIGKVTNRILVQVLASRIAYILSLFCLTCSFLSSLVCQLAWLTPFISIVFVVACVALRLRPKAACFQIFIDDVDDDDNDDVSVPCVLYFSLQQLLRITFSVIFFMMRSNLSHVWKIAAPMEGKNESSFCSVLLQHFRVVFLLCSFQWEVFQQFLGLCEIDLFLLSDVYTLMSDLFLRRFSVDLLYN